MTRIGNKFRDERGGVMVIVALCFVGLSVILGAASLSIDVGKLMWERRELQNGADAAALSLAQNCAKEVNCVENDLGIKALAEGNAKDGLHTIERECQSPAVSGSLTPCLDVSNVSDLRQCPPLRAPYDTLPNLKYVEVRTESLSPEGSFVTNWLAGIAGGDNQSTLLSCSRVAWGPTGGAKVLPLTFSKCEFDDAMLNGGFHDPAEGMYDGEIALATMYAKDAGPCPGDFKMDGAGAFGWVGDGDCEVTVEDGWIPGDPGEDATLGCFKPGDTVLIPIFDEYVSSGKQYHLDGFAAFYITGYEFPGAPPKIEAIAGHPGPDAKNECEAESNNKKFCLYGWFLGDYVDGSGSIDTGGGSDYGAITIQPMG